MTKYDEIVQAAKQSAGTFYCKKCGQLIEANESSVLSVDTGAHYHKRCFGPKPN